MKTLFAAIEGIQGRTAPVKAQKRPGTRTIKGVEALTAMVFAAFLALSGCVTYDSAVPASTGIGAGGGALLGYGLTGTATGAAAGAGAGMLAGALTGVIIDETRRESSAPPPAYQAPPSAQYQAASQTYATQTDPTIGAFLNNTRWRLEIYIDRAEYPLSLDSLESQPVALDIGEHQVAAEAYVPTQFGERFVGTTNLTLYVDPRNSGWNLRFDEAMF